MRVTKHVLEILWVLPAIPAIPAIPAQTLNVAEQFRKNSDHLSSIFHEVQRSVMTTGLCGQPLPLSDHLNDNN